MKNFPEFLIIGAARAGTTALYSYLRQHPDVFMPQTKEPNFFAFEDQNLACSGPGADYINNSVTKLAQYEALFASAKPTDICGEASPLYLFSDSAAARIQHHVPKAKLILILRNPVEQAFSHFLYATKQAIETEPNFENALMLEQDRLSQGWQPLFGYSSFPRYGEQLERFLKYFPREQLFIRTYRDFKTDPQTLLCDMFEFIGADTGFSPDMSAKPNAGGVPKNRALQDFLMKSNPITRAIGLVVPQEARLAIRDRIARFNVQNEVAISPRAREILHERLDDDMRHLAEIVDCDLSHWWRDTP